MKYLFTAILSALALVSLSEAQDKGVHLFILSGQSNMENLDPKISFTPAVRKEFGKDNVLVFKNAYSGQPIKRWYKGWVPTKAEKQKPAGDLYIRLMRKLLPKIKGKKIQTVTFVWMQGEADAREDGAVYAVSLKGVLTQIKTDLKIKEINVVIGRLSDFVSKKFPEWDMVRDALVKVAEEEDSGAWVDTDDLNDTVLKPGKSTMNSIHYTPEGYEILGERFAEKSIELIRKRLSSV